MKKIPALLGGALITVSAASAAIGLTGVRTDIKEFSPRTLVPTEISSKDIKAKGLKPVVKESALTTSSRMSAPAREGSSEGWTSIGTGLFTDAVFPDMFNGIEPTTFDVEIEQNDADPTTYRIVNPYANWDNPYSNLTYHDNPATIWSSTLSMISMHILRISIPAMSSLTSQRHLVRVMTISSRLSARHNLS